MVEPNSYQGIARWLIETARWINENIADEELWAIISEDLDLSKREVPPAVKKRLVEAQASLESKEDDIDNLDEAVLHLAVTTGALIKLVEMLVDDQADVWDTLFLLARVIATEQVRRVSPLAYGLGKILVLIGDDPERVEEFDPALVMGLISGQPVPPDNQEEWLRRITTLSWLPIIIGEQVALLFDTDPRDFYEAYYGWDADPAPAVSTPVADMVSARAVTLLFGPPDGVRLGITILGVPRDHQGPALYLGFGGGINVERKSGDTTYKFDTGAAGALDLLIPFSDSPMKFQAGGSPTAWVKLDVIRARNGGPALVLGDPDKTRIEVERLLFSTRLGTDGASFRAGVEKGKLIIDLADSGGLLSVLSAGKVEIEFGLVMSGDTRNGLRIEGGTRARARLPVASPRYGPLTIHYLEAALTPAIEGPGVGLEITGAIGLTLGPFQATVDGMGITAAVAFKEGNLGIVDASIGFNPPKGIGLSLDTGLIKGGGYLFLDSKRGEFAGAIELTIGPVGVKAIGLLSTKLPQGAGGWALLLLVYGQFPPIQLSFGFTLNGVGGMIGLQHGVNIEALTKGMAAGALDSILFPKDPVADAPKIINQLRNVFPITPRAITFGPMLELGWGTPSIMVIRLGVIVQLDNAIGGGPVSFARLVVIGQLRMQMLPEKTGTPPLLKLLVDFLGYYDVDTRRVGFVARLRDSKLSEITLSGMLVVFADFKAPAFVVSAGGFHPRFEGIPEGTPAPIDRIGFGFSIGIVKVRFECYVAVTPATVQLGAGITAVAKIGPVAIEGYLTFDAIFYFHPIFRFEADIRAGIAVKFKGHTLAGVDLRGTLSGPGLWRIAGRFSFSILFWDVSKSFDESFGSAPPTPVTSVKVHELIQAELANKGNWSAQLPTSGRAMVTLGDIHGVAGALAHPLGKLAVTQHVAPFGLSLDKFGAGRIDGPNRFDVEKVTIGTREATNPTLLKESFARAQFVEMSEEEKLSRPSFESLPAGFEVGSDVFTLPDDQIGADLEYETLYLEPPSGGLLSSLVIADLIHSHLTTVDIAALAATGAVARSDTFRTASLTPPQTTRIKVSEPPLAVAGQRSMKAAVDLGETAMTSTAAAEETIKMMGLDHVQLVEAFELVSS